MGILDHEQREDWLQALNEYNSLHWFITSRNREHNPSSQVVALAEFKNIDVIEQGRLHCLIELGQLESAVDQVWRASQPRLFFVSTLVGLCVVGHRSRSTKASLRGCFSALRSGSLLAANVRAVSMLW
jgi:hypothetical protein